MEAPQNWITRARVFALVALGLTSLVGPTACSTTAEESSAEDDLDEATQVFSATTALDLKLTAPLQQLFERRRLNRSDPHAPGMENVYSERGKLSLGARAFDVTVLVRGNTSTLECTFPKYKIEFLDKTQTRGTIFQGRKSVRMNSHCGDEPEGSPNAYGRPYGRRLNEISPIREELAYRILRGAEIPTYQTRLMRVSYTDSSPQSPLPPMTRHALMIESGGDAGKRFAKAGIIAADGVYLQAADNNPMHAGVRLDTLAKYAVARAALGHVLVANTDWSVSADKLWNIDVFGKANTAGQLPIPQDFDLGAFVRAPANLRIASDLDNAALLYQMVRFSAEETAAAKASINLDGAIKAIDRAEAEGIAAQRLPSSDGQHTTDRGFQGAREAVAAFRARRF